MGGGGDIPNTWGQTWLPPCRRPPYCETPRTLGLYQKHFFGSHYSSMPLNSHTTTENGG